MTHSTDDSLMRKTETNRTDALCNALNKYEVAGGAEFWQDVVPEFADLVDVDTSLEAEETEFEGYTCVVVLKDSNRLTRDDHRVWRLDAPTQLTPEE